MSWSSLPKDIKRIILLKIIRDFHFIFPCVMYYRRHAFLLLNYDLLRTKISDKFCYDFPTLCSILSLIDHDCRIILIKMSGFSGHGTLFRLIP